MGCEGPRVGAAYRAAWRVVPDANPKLNPTPIPTPKPRYDGDGDAILAATAAEGGGGKGGATVRRLLGTRPLAWTGVRVRVRVRVGVRVGVRFKG